jgi:hypothetical protein
VFSANLFAQSTSAEAEAVLPGSVAQQQFKLLTKEKRDEIARERGKEIPAENLKQTPKPSAEPRPAAENILKLEEIRVFGKVDPEDYVRPKVAPMLQFRATLDGQRPKTPAENMQLLMCFVGLCGIYGPDGAPVDSGAAYRQEARKDATTVELSRMRGTLQ